MALKVGELYVSLSANVSQFTRSMDRVLGDIDRVTKSMKRLSGDVAQAAAPIAAAVTGIVLAAAKTNVGVARELDKLKKMFATVANDLGQALLPALKQVTDFVGQLVARFQALNPETKAQVAHWLAMGVKITAAAFAMQKFMAAANALTGVVRLVLSLGSAFMVALVPLLAVAGIIAGVILIVGALRIAWEENLFGMRDAWTALVNAAGPAWAKFVDFMKSAFNNAVGYVSLGIAKLIRAWATVTEALGGDDNANKAMGFRSKAEEIEKFAKAAFDGEVWNDFVDTARRAASEVSAVMGQAADNVAKAWKKGLDTVGITKLVNSTKGALAGLFGGTVGAPDLIDGPANPALAAGAGKLAKSIHNQGTGAVAKVAKDRNIDTTLSDAAKKAAEALLAAKEASDKAAESLKSRFMGAIGKVGSMIGNAGQAAALGDGLGAVASIFLDLAITSRGFQNAVAVADAVIQEISDSLFAFLEPLAPLIAGVGMIVSAIFTIFKGMDLEGVFKFLFQVLRDLARTILEVAFGIASFWNDMIGVLADVFPELKGAMIDKSGLAGAIATLSGMTWAQVEAKAAEITATQSAASAANAVAAAFLNVPTGYKVAKARFNATQAEGGGGSFPSFSKSGGAANITINVNGTTDPKSVAREVTHELERRRFGRTGAFPDFSEGF